MKAHASRRVVRIERLMHVAELLLLLVVGVQFDETNDTGDQRVETGEGHQWNAIDHVER